LIYCQQPSDPAAAIYHFRKLLKLHPEWRHAETARLKIRDCEIEIAKSVPLGPRQPALQQQYDQMVARFHETDREIKSLRVTNQMLHMQLQQVLAENAQLKEAWRTAETLAAAPPTLSTSPPPAQAQRSGHLGTGPSAPESQAAPARPVVLPTPTPRLDTARPTTVTPTTPTPMTGRRSIPTAYRQYTVRRGETMIQIARRYGISLRALTQANPTINPDRLRVGQVVRIPAS